MATPWDEVVRVAERAKRGQGRVLVDFCRVFAVVLSFSCLFQSLLLDTLSLP